MHGASDRLRAWDTKLLRIARTAGHSPEAERAVARFSRLGEHAALWLALGAGGSLLSHHQRRAWRRATVAIAATYAVNTVIKFLVRRPRPSLAGLPPLASTPSRLSFPSAHTATSVAATLLYARLGIPKGPLRALTAGLAYSRLYLGVHYPSDVLAGAILGSTVACGARALAHGPTGRTAHLPGERER